MALKQVIEERKPKVIGINRSKIFAFSDGLSSGELQGMSEALGATWTAKFKDAEGLPLELIASRLPEEEAFFQKMTALVWQMTQTMFSDKVIVPGMTSTSDLVWWWRQRTNDQGLGTWFQPSVEHSAEGRQDERDRRGCRHPAWRRAALRRRHHRRAPEHRHAAQRVRAAAGRDRRARRPQEALANANAMQDIADGRSAARPHRQRDPRRGARTHEGARASTARCTRIRSA